MNRDQKFGRLLAIANVLGDKVFEDNNIGIADKHMSRFSKKPALAFEKIHKELMEYAPQFGQDEMQLMNMFEEILADMDESEFTNEPLNPVYLHSYYTQQNALDSVIGVDEAADILGLSPGTVKNYCATGKIEAKKIGKTWVIDKNKLNKGTHTMAKISIDNGNSFVTAEEAINGIDWEEIVSWMDDDIREQVHSELAPCSNLEFLERYLELADRDIIIG